jgi:hypothetical protein
MLLPGNKTSFDANSKQFETEWLDMPGWNCLGCTLVVGRGIFMIITLELMFFIQNIPVNNFQDVIAFIF